MSLLGPLPGEATVMRIIVSINHRTVEQKSRAQSALNKQNQKRNTKHSVMLPCVLLAIIQQNRATSSTHKKDS